MKRRLYLFLFSFVLIAFPFEGVVRAQELSCFSLLGSHRGSGKRVLDVYQRAWSLLRGKLKSTEWVQLLSSVLERLDHPDLSREEKLEILLLKSEGEFVSKIDVPLLRRVFEEIHSTVQTDFTESKKELFIQSAIRWIKLEHREVITQKETQKKVGEKDKALENLALPLRHADRISAAVISPTGESVITADEKGFVKVWNPRTGELSLELNDLEFEVSLIQFSPDGRRFLTVLKNSTVKVWETDTGKFVSGLIGHEKAIHFARFSHDGRKILTGSSDKTTKIWNAETGGLIKSLEHVDGVVDGRFSFDDQQIITGGFYRRREPHRKPVIVWRIGQEEISKHLEGLKAAAFFVQLIKDGSRAVAASRVGTILIWDLETGEKVEIYENDSHIIYSIDLSPDEKRVVTTPENDTAKIWNIETGQLQLVLKGHTDWINSARFSSNGLWVVTGADDGLVKVWDSNTGEQVLSWRGNLGRVREVSFSPDGTQILVFGEKREVYVVNWQELSREVF